MAEYAVKRTLEPAQNVVGPPAAILAVGKPKTVTVITLDDETHPFKVIFKV